MLTRRGSHACAVQDGQLYAFGGWAAQHPLVSHPLRQHCLDANTDTKWHVA